MMATMIFNSVLVVATVRLVLGLYFMGAGTSSLWGLLLMLASCSYSSERKA